jgi:hypothetical protein
MRDRTFVQKAEEVVMERDPLTSKQIANIVDYKKERPGRSLSRSRNLFYIGSGRSGVWYLEHQVQEAQNIYRDICEYVEKKREERRHEKLYLPVNPNIHSFLTLFRTDEDAFTTRRFWQIVGGNLIDVGRHLTKLKESGILIADGRPMVFRRNPEFANICGDAAEEIFKDYFK